MHSGPQSPTSPAHHAPPLRFSSSSALVLPSCLQPFFLAPYPVSFLARTRTSSPSHLLPSLLTRIGRGFNNLTDCSRGLIELQREVQRSLADEIVIPMSSRMNVDMRNVQRLEKDYMKQCTQQVELINKTEKEIEKWQKKVHCWLGLLSLRFLAVAWRSNATVHIDATAPFRGLGIALAVPVTCRGVGGVLRQTGEQQRPPPHPLPLCASQFSARICVWYFNHVLTWCLEIPRRWNRDPLGPPDHR